MIETNVWMPSLHQIDRDERLDAITTSNKYIVSNLMEMSDSSGTDSDDD